MAGPEDIEADEPEDETPIPADQLSEGDPDDTRDVGVDTDE